MRKIFTTIAISLVMAGAVTMTAFDGEKVENNIVETSIVTTTTEETTTTTTTTETTTTTTETTITTTTEETTTIPTTTSTTTTAAAVTTTATTTTAREIIVLTTTTTTESVEYYPTAEEVASALVSIGNDCLNYQIIGASNYSYSGGTRKGTIIYIDCNDKEDESKIVRLCLDLMVEVDSENRVFSIKRICTLGDHSNERDELLTIFPMVFC